VMVAVDEVLVIMIVVMTIRIMLSCSSCCCF
jgi:hypothetical protein